MRIGIDATALPNRPVGAGKYIIEFSRALASVAEGDELVIFVQRSRLPLLAIQETQRVRLAMVEDLPVPLRLAWEQTVFPMLIKRYGIEVLHSPHYTMPYLRPCRHVVAFHDMTFFLFPQLHTRTKRLLFPRMIRLSARRADHVLASSENTRQDALRLLGISDQKISTVFLGVSAHYQPEQNPASLALIRHKYELPEKFLLYVGLVEPRKNLLMLFNAYHAVKDRYPDFRLVVVGRFGWDYEAVLQQLEALDLRDRVHFTGYIPEEELATVYNLAEAFVYPSVYEGFGLPVLEAMACGTPVITSNVSSMPEVVGKAGLLIPPANEPALIQAMDTLLADESLRDELRRKSLARSALFPWERTARESLAVYHKIIGS